MQEQAYLEIITLEKVIPEAQKDVFFACFCEVCCYQTLRNEQAQGCFKKVREADSGHISANIYTALIIRQNEQYAEAIPHFISDGKHIFGTIH